ncbi:MAG TPA: ATP-dependent DNA ligase [Candidatus Dormibacteraeota bacterium]|nr:ATP-dependent DNA ligase [Candidatus Dormibacteraeota bacterium]
MDDLTRETPFFQLAQLCRRVEATTKRNEKIALISEFLGLVGPDEVPLVTLFLAGKPFPESDPRVLEISYATITEVSRNLGQQKLTENPLTISDVYATLEKIAEMSGSKSRDRKTGLLQTLLTQASPVESEFLVRMMLGEMRIGVVEGVLLDAIAEASRAPRELVRRAHMLHGDIGEVARLAMSKGASALERISLSLFVPVKPMLAEMAEDVQEVLAEHNDDTAFEYKLDGARIQIHRKNGRVRIFSRRLTDVTDSIPEIVEFALSQVKASEFLIEGEVVATSADGRPIPFQDLMRRFRRVYGIENMATKIPLKLYLFDALEVDGKTLIDEPYNERWRILSEIVPVESLTPRIVTSDVHEVESFLRSALKEGHEGLMAKSLTSNYSIGARGKKWFKIKPADRLDVVIVAADWGSGRRVGWLSNYHLAVRNQDTGKFMVIGKTFKGLTDAEFETITNRLQELKTRDGRYTVYVKPSIVAEVAYNEIQKSPRYKSGFALRFARISRFRDDKRPEDADTLQRLQELYDKQFEHKARYDS